MYAKYCASVRGAGGGGVLTTVAVGAVVAAATAAGVGSGHALDGRMMLPGTQVHSQADGKVRGGPLEGWQQTEALGSGLGQMHCACAVQRKVRRSKMETKVGRDIVVVEVLG